MTTCLYHPCYPGLCYIWGYGVSQIIKYPKIPKTRTRTTRPINDQHKDKKWHLAWFSSNWSAQYRRRKTVNKKYKWRNLLLQLHWAFWLFIFSMTGTIVDRETSRELPHASCCVLTKDVKPQVIILCSGKSFIETTYKIAKGFLENNRTDERQRMSQQTFYQNNQ